MQDFKPYKRKSFEGHEKNIEVFEAYTKCWTLIWYPKGSQFELIGYSDSDYAGCNVDRKSTSGTCQLLGRSLVSWSSKKQNSVALKTTEVEYIFADSCCAQLLWI